MNAFRSDKSRNHEDELPVFKNFHISLRLLLETSGMKRGYLGTIISIDLRRWSQGQPWPNGQRYLFSKVRKDGLIVETSLMEIKRRILS